MKKNISQIIDELTVTNIKIFYLTKKIGTKPSTEEAKKVKDLEKYHLELMHALDRAKPMKKSLSSIIDELTVTNIKIFYLVEKIEKNKHTLEDAKAAHDLNRYRSKLCNAINLEFKEMENIKV